MALCLLAPLGDAAAFAVSAFAGFDSDDPIAHIAITGTASDRNLAEYELLISPAGKEQWTRLVLGTSSADGCEEKKNIPII